MATEHLLLHQYEIECDIPMTMMFARTFCTSHKIRAEEFFGTPTEARTGSNTRKIHFNWKPNHHGDLMNVAVESTIRLYIHSH